LESAFQTLQDSLNTEKIVMTKFQLQLLLGELTKTEENKIPSANTIILVGNWLLENVPEMAEVLADLFATPAVGKIMGKAGGMAVEWVKERFAR
jgi:hypothetical protein